MSLFSKLSKNNDKNLYPWSQKKLSGSNSTLPRAGHAAVSITSDAVVIFGGVHKSNTKKELFYIDTNTLTATSINASGDVPSPRISPAMVSMNSHIMLYGGRPLSPEESYDNSFYVLNLHNRQWTRVHLDGVQPMERYGHTAIAHDGIMYMFGGQKEGTYFNDLFIFNSSTFNSTPHWDKVIYSNECPEPRSGHVSAIFENKLYIFGGTNGYSLLNDIWFFDLQTGLWSRIDADGFIPAARESCASAMADDVIYIIGGKGDNGIELNDLCAYKIKSRRWFRFQNMGPAPSPRHGLTMTAVKERLFVIGGENETSKMEDASSVYILDSLKIKYPADTPSPIEATNSDQMYQQQQHQNQYQPRLNLPESPVQQQQPRTTTTVDTDLQGSPTSNNSPISPTSRQRSYYPEQNNNNVRKNEHEIDSNSNGSFPQPPVRPPRHISTVPEAALRRPRGTSPLPPIETENSPTSSIESEPLTLSPPPRPPRDGVGLDRPKSQVPIRNQSVPMKQNTEPVPERSPSRQVNGENVLSNSTSHVPLQQQVQPQTSTPTQQQEQISQQPQIPLQDNTAAINEAVNTATASLKAAADEERQTLIKEIQSRDAIISEIKQKESWWRTEVSLARKQRNKTDTYDDGPEADETLLMDVDHLSEDKVKLFEQLVAVKSELRRVRASVLQQAQPMSDKVSQADRMRTAALQEAAYFKSKYLALKARRQGDLVELDLNRCDDLEKRLASVLSENETNSKLLQQLQKQSQHDQMARVSTEERAHEAQIRAEEAQQAHQRALEELQLVYARATKAEVQVRDNINKIADLTQQLSEALSAQPVTKSQEVTEAQLKASQLEAANLKARNETASLKQKLAEQMDDIASLTTLLQEREDQVTEAQHLLEDYKIQLSMLKEAVQQKNPAVNHAPTKAY